MNWYEVPAYKYLYFYYSSYSKTLIMKASKGEKRLQLIVTIMVQQLNAVQQHPCKNACVQGNKDRYIT